ncbi:2TM domain-containing protein [Leptolyngbya sp. FACHB-261]|uniref:2TM domain-containing protein n=1 Tax=Leptolyngbya sp. FACHB-261 TaxID=2692806 RepID=UPI0016849F95|nr:2TM domain-containing protein [Leptolyngbya sp. FACHB-261]MBD2103766.1 2TM domain-containing protein [Leptolyngbya sp. FACHB-261]
MTDSYSQEDVQQILHLAIRRQVQDGDELSHEQLVEIASEMGISSQDLRAAEQEWVGQRQALQQQQTFNNYRRYQLRENVVKFGIINTFLVSLNIVMTGEPSWSLMIVLVWGLGLALNTWKTYQTEGEEYEKSFQRWRRKHQFKQTLNTVLDRLLKA